MKLALICFLVSSFAIADAVKLQVHQDGFYYNGAKVFLSGVNIAWNYYGYDFGNHQYESAGPKLESWLEEIKNNGGNSVRIWLHVEGDNSPHFDGDGFVLGTDRDGTLVDELLKFLDVAKSKNIVVVIVLWNRAVLRNQNAINLAWDDSKLKTYIEKALKPMAKALSDHPALGAWEVINEYEGSLRVPETSSNKCFDTNVLQGSGAGWTGVSIPMERYLRFTNWQLAALREADPMTPVTTSGWSEKATTSAFGGCFNFVSDECLRAAGGEQSGVVDFYQIHTYAFGGAWNPSAPFNGHKAESYKLEKPLVIGEFASESSQGESVEQLYEYAYTNGYSGAWGWSYNVDSSGTGVDDRAKLNRGMQHLKGRTDHGIVNFTLE